MTIVSFGHFPICIEFGLCKYQEWLLGCVKKQKHFSQNSLSMILTLLTMLILLVDLYKNSKFDPEIFDIILH